ncbi:MAG: hypothetical protein IJB96_05215 [Lachnospira sp.]|nr:hypothetical protein [Lachnospira sp.]
MELKRVFSRNTCFVLMAIVVVSMLFYYLEFRTYMKQEEYYVGMVKYYEEYKDSKEPVRNMIRDFYSENSEDVKNNKTAYSLARKQLEKRIDYVDRYGADITGKIDYANTMLTLNLFSDLSVYEKRNLNKNISDLNQLKSVEVKVDNSMAFDSLFQYDLAQYMLILMVLVTVYRFVKERKNSVTELIYATPYGRLRLNVQRTLILFVSSVVYAVVLYGTVLCVGALMFGGFGSLNNPLQCSSDFSVLNFIGSRLDFLVYYVIMSGIMAYVVGLIFWAVTNLFVSYQIGITTFFIGMAAQAVVYYAVPINSIVRFLHYINIFQLVNSCDVLCNYENWGYSWFILSVRDTVYMIAIVLLLMAVSIIAVYCTKVRPVRSVSKVEMLIEKLAVLKRKAIEKMPHFMKELYKSLILEKGLVFLAVVVLLVFNNRLGRYVPESEFDTLGQFYDLAEDITLGEELDELIEDYEVMYDKALQSEYGESYAKMYEGLINEADLQKEYLIKLKERGIEGRIIKQEPYEAMFGYQIQSNQQLYALLAMLAVVMMCFGIESYEKYCGMKDLITASPGRGGNAWRKISMVAIYAVIIGVIIYGLNWYDILHKYEPGSLDAPIQSVHMMENCVLNVSIAQYCALIGIFRIVVLILLSLGVYYISKRFSYYGSLGVSAIIMVPQIMVLCGVDIVKYMSIGTLLAKTVFM